MKGEANEKYFLPINGISLRELESRAGFILQSR